VTFIDTNVLVYAAAGGAPLFDRARPALAKQQTMAWYDQPAGLARIPLGDDPATDVGKSLTLS
jgi:hypothetical protein